MSEVACGAVLEAIEENGGEDLASVPPVFLLSAAIFTSVSSNALPTLDVSPHLLWKTEQLPPAGEAAAGKDVE